MGLFLKYLDDVKIRDQYRIQILQYADPRVKGMMKREKS
jgi:hypothetical protein